MSVTFRKPYCPSKGQSFNEPSQCVPGQAYNLKELVERFSRGERLLLNQRPIDIHPMDEDGNLLDGSVDETFENIVPQIEDPVDLHKYQDELKSRHEDVDKRIKSKKEQKEKEKQQKELEIEQKEEK